MIDETLALLKLFSDKNRVLLLLLLAESPTCVCEMAELLQVTPASVSRNINLFSKLGIVEGKKESFWTLYSLKITNHKAKALYGLISSWLDEVPELDEIKSRASSLDRSKFCRGKEI